MTAADDELNVEVPVSTEEPVEVVLEGEQTGEQAVDEREAALNSMKAQLEAVKKQADQERIARQRAEQYAYQQAQNAQYAQAEAATSTLRGVQNAIDATEQTALAAERAYADAMAAGDYNLAAKCQRAMAAAETQIGQLLDQKRNIENYMQTTEGRVQEPQYQAPTQPQPPQDPVEALASRLSPKSAEWLRAHPEAAYKSNKLVAAHQAAVELEGITPETPEYFAFVERTLGIGKAAPSRKAMASAPVSSASSPLSSRSSGGNSMVLSAAEVEQAILMEPDLPRDKAIESYAKAKAALIREGKMHA